ncbi:hypothetical protein B0H19DRAFT_224899 [Mycena capillaripes]|nr:hypothetical protein B0H19DRAFT_224899 [Mycena capillaripes]
MPKTLMVLSGFIAQTVGVKYIFITIAGSCAFAVIFGIPLLRETYAPVIRHRIAARLGDSEKLDRLDADLLQACGDKLYSTSFGPSPFLSEVLFALFRAYTCRCECYFLFMLKRLVVCTASIICCLLPSQISSKRPIVSVLLEWLIRSSRHDGNFPPDHPLPRGHLHLRR